MDLLSILQSGASAILQNSDQATTALDSNQLVSALSQMFGREGGTLDLGAVVSKMQQVGLGSIVTSWLGKGANEPISPDAVTDLVSADKIQAFASQFGLSENIAKNAIASALPAMVDNASPDGSLLDDILGNLGGLGGLAGFVRKLI